MKKLLSIQEAADLIDVHPETLRRWDNDGKLKAIKIGSRKDRKYRREDLLKILSGHTTIEYGGYEIVPYSFGFEISPGTLIRIASFIVQKDSGISVFAFAEGMLTRMSHAHLKDRDLLEEAVGIIKQRIDDNRVKNLEEYTFEYYPSNFVEMRNPHWWIKSLKKYYGKSRKENKKKT